jgi:hypothetical protein
MAQQHDSDARDLELIYAILRMASSGGSLDETLAFSLPHLVQRTQAQSVGVFVLDEKKRSAHLFSQFGMAEPLQAALRDFPLDLSQLTAGGEPFGLHDICATGDMQTLADEYNSLDISSTPCVRKAN